MLPSPLRFYLQFGLLDLELGFVAATMMSFCPNNDSSTERDVYACGHPNALRPPCSSRGPLQALRAHNATSICFAGSRTLVAFKPLIPLPLGSTAYVALRFRHSRRFLAKHHPRRHARVKRRPCVEHLRCLLRDRCRGTGMLTTIHGHWLLIHESRVSFT